jgi:hypothetical protein
MTDKRKVLHEDGFYRRVKYQNLDFTGLTGPVVTSTSEASILFGTQYFTLDEDGEHIKTGCVAQINHRGDPDVWMWGLIMDKDTTKSPARIKFAGLILSEQTIQDNQDWEIQIMSGPLLGFSPDATIGISSDSFMVPSTGQVISANILAGKLVSRNTSLLFSSAANPQNFFRMRVTSYDEDTGDVEGIVTAHKYDGSGPVSAWLVGLIPGPVSGASLSPTSITLWDANYNDADSTSSIQVAVPAGTQAGDIIVLCSFAVETTGGMPDQQIDVLWNWAQLESIGYLGTPDYSMLIRAVLADGSEAGEIVTISDADGDNCYWRAVIIVFRPDSPATGFSFHDPQKTSSLGTSLVIDTTGAENPMILLGAMGNVHLGTPGTQTFSTTEDGSVNITGSSNYSLELAYEIFDTQPGGDTTISYSFAGGAIRIGGCIELFGTPAEPGDVVVFEDDGSGGPAYPAGDGSNIDLSGHTAIVGLPKAIYAATITPTLLTGNISSVDTGTDVITWSSDLAAQGVVTGDTVIPAVGGTWPTGATTRGALYIYMLSATTFTLHLTLADALAGTSPINLTAAGSGTRTMHKLVHSDVGPNFGVSSVSPIGGSGTYETTMGFSVNFDPPLPDANRMIITHIFGMTSGSTVVGGGGWGFSHGPSTKTTTHFDFLGSGTDIVLSGVPGGATPGRATKPTSWAGQGVNPFRVEIIVF